VIDETLARSFQDKYIQGERGAMAGLYAECRHIADRLTRRYAATIKHRFPEEAIDQISHDATSRLLVRYQSPGYFIRSFSSILFREVKHAATEGGRGNGNGSKKVKFNRSLLPIEAARAQKIEKAEGMDPFESLLQHPRRLQIIVDIVRASTYRKAILQIGDYIDHEWMRARASELLYVYRMTRNGKERGSIQYRRGSAKGV
jgi:hypothetical protein